MLNTRVLVCEGAKTKRGGNLCATISVCGLGCHRASMSSALHLGLELRLLETSLRHAEPADEHPGIHMCEKNPARHQEPLTKGRNGDAQEVPSTKKGCMTPLCLYAI